MRERGRVARAILALLLAVLYAPLLFLVVASVNRNPASTGWQGFTGQWYSRAFDDPALRAAVGVSVRLALGASALALLIGTAAAVAARRTRLLSKLNIAVASARIATPEIILATGIAAALPTVGIAFGLRSMLVAHVAYLSAYAMLIVGARAAGSPVHLEEAALDLGARRWQVLRDIVLPDLRPAIGSAGMLVFAFSFDDVALSLALRGPSDTTVPIYIFSAVQRRVTPSIHAIGALTVAVGVVTFAGAVLVNRAITAGQVGPPGRDQARP